MSKLEKINTLADNPNTLLSHLWNKYEEIGGELSPISTQLLHRKELLDKNITNAYKLFEILTKENDKFNSFMVDIQEIEKQVNDINLSSSINDINILLTDLENICSDMIYFLIDCIGIKYNIELRIHDI